MEVLKTLTERVSSPNLTEPGPTDDQLQLLFKAALRAPDHANLRPWRFMIIRGDAREKLGNIFADITVKDNPNVLDASLERMRQLPMRAPVVVSLILSYKEHPKVPEVEQILSLGAAGHGLLTAAYQLGIGAYWRTGALCFDSRVARALNLAKNEKLMGFIYLGTIDGELKPVPNLAVEEFVTHWT